MKSWPLPDSFSNTLPRDGDRGSYWEDRHIGHNCGVDLFCPPNSEVLAIDSGVVLAISTFSEPSDEHCFESTLQCVIKCDAIIYKYCFISEICVKLGQKVSAGDKLGICGVAINKQNINGTDPFYLREIAHNGNTSLLHLELFKAPVMEVRPYKFGNYMGDITPTSVINPVLYLSGLSKQSQI